MSDRPASYCVSDLSLAFTQASAIAEMVLDRIADAKQPVAVDALGGLSEILQMMSKRADDLADRVERAEKVAEASQVLL